MKNNWHRQFLLLLLGISFGTVNVAAQSGYFVYLSDKPCLDSPARDFDVRALQRRSQQGISFPMWEDYPVSAEYQEAIALRVDTVRFALRWINAVSVVATASQIREVLSLPFVAQAVPFEQYQIDLCNAESENEAWGKTNPAREKKLDTLFHLHRARMQLDTLLEMGLTGKGVRIAVFDAGFKGVLNHPAFERLRARGGILESRDFYNGGKNPLGHSRHGTAVLGCLAGWYKGVPIGAAPEASYLLARTEYSLREKVKEEDAWMAAAEWADRKGADIISSSLSYTHPLHSYAEMDGKTTIVSKAARMAIRKGILVVNSAGNEGADKFHFIGAPGDVDSVLTVGASYPMISFPMPFSSFGPNARKVTKPDVAATGYLVSTGRKKSYDFFSGTSFACPTVAGMAACLMQAHPDKSAMDIRQQIVEAGHFYPYYDYALGYGVVDARNFFRKRENNQATFSVEMNRDTLFIVFDETIVGADTLENRNGSSLFFHFADEQGRLKEYRYFRVLPGIKKVGIPPAQRPSGRMRIWFAGYLLELSE